MIKFKSRVLTLLLVFCISLIGCVVNSQQISSKEVGSEMVAMADSKQVLARDVLSEIGMPERYNLYLGNSVDIALSPETASNNKFIAWMQSLFVEEAGWSHIEDQYITQLSANFSETELRELLDLAKQPLMKKFLQTEIEAYANSSEERRNLLVQLWNNYNNGMFSPPPEVLQN